MRKVCELTNAIGIDKFSQGTYVRKWHGIVVYKIQYCCALCIFLLLHISEIIFKLPSKCKNTHYALKMEVKNLN